MVTAVLVLATLVLAVPAGRRPFWTKDEPRYALLARDMLDHGRWLSPALRGQPYLNKPQLFIWAIALISMPGGEVTELTAALPAIAASVATVGAVIAIGSLLWNPLAGALAGLILAVTPIHFLFGHWVLPDVLLTTWMTWALYWLLRARRQDWAWAPLAAFYACVGLAVLSKGPAGFSALLAAAAAAFSAGGVARLWRLRPAPGLGVIAAILLPWLGAYGSRSLDAFLHDVVVGDYLDRYFSAGAAGRFEQIGLVLPHFLPWTLVLLAAAFWWRYAPGDDGRRWVGMWTVTLWLVLGMSGVQRARYLLPVFPGLALLTAEFLARAGDGRALLFLRRATLGLLILGGLVAALLIVAPGLTTTADTEERVVMPDRVWERIALVALALSAAGAAWLLAHRGRPVRSAAAMGAGVGAMLVVIGFAYPLRFTSEHDVRPLAAVAAAQLGPGGVVIGHPDLRLAWDFYLRQPVRELAQPGEVAERLAIPRPDVLITTRARWSDLAPRVDPRWRLIAERRVGSYDFVVVASGAKAP